MQSKTSSFDGTISVSKISWDLNSLRLITGFSKSHYSFGTVKEFTIGSL